MKNKIISSILTICLSAILMPAGEIKEEGADMYRVMKKSVLRIMY